MLETTQGQAFKARMQKVNEWGNTWSGLIAAAGFAVTVLILVKQTRKVA